MSNRSSLQGNITLYLQEWQRGSETAGEALIQAVYCELKKISSAYLKKEQRSAFQTTDLVNEAFIRLVEQREIEWQDRIQFYGVAANLMRQILIESVRKKNAQKRGGGLPTLELKENVDFAERRSLDLIKLDDALAALATIDAQKARLVELRFFTGLTIEESSQVLGISPASVKREWVLAKAWLHRHMTTDREK